MTPLSLLSGREVVAALSRAGYEKDRQRGSYIVLRQVAIPTDGLPSRITPRSPRGYFGRYPPGGLDF